MSTKKNYTKSIVLAILASGLIYTSSWGLTKSFDIFVRSEHFPIKDELTAWVVFTVVISIIAAVVLYYAIRVGDPLLQ